MTTTRVRGRRITVPAILVVAGGGLAAATWVGGEHGLAVGLLVFYVVAAVIAYVWAGRDTDVAAIMRVGGDERQQRIDRDAVAFAGLVMVWVAIVGAIVSAAVNHGQIGVFGVMAAVGGTSYAAAVAYLRRRR